MIGPRPNILQPISVALGDLMVTVTLDMVTNGVFGFISVFLNNGVGPSPTRDALLRGEPYKVALGDLDGDGDLDMAVGNMDAAANLAM